MNKRYAVAYINDGDPMTTHNGHAICLFGQTDYEVNLFKRYYVAYIPEKKTPADTYNALEKALSKKLGKEVILVFSQREPTIWKVKCQCPKGYHDMFVECRGY